MTTIIIPSAGKGTRLQGVSKPLTPIGNSFMLLESIRTLGLSKHNHILIVQQSIYNDVLKIKPHLTNCKIISLDYFTTGPSTTALLAEPYVDPNEELIICNCDQIMNWDVGKFLSSARVYDGCVVTHTSSDKKNSFARLDANSRVVEIREKKPISNIALIGVHYWKHAKYFFESAKEQQQLNMVENGEYYIAPTYNMMIKRGLSVGIYPITKEECWMVGTTVDLEIFLKENNK